MKQVKQTEYKDFDDVIIRQEDKDIFSSLNGKKLTFPKVILKSVPWTIVKILFNVATIFFCYMTWWAINFEMIFTSFLILFIPALISLYFIVFQIIGLYYQKMFIVQEDKICFPAPWWNLKSLIKGKLIELSYANVYEIYTTEKSADWVTITYIGIHVVNSPNDINSRKRFLIQVDGNYDDIRLVAKTAHLAMLNYHYKYHISNLPSLKYIQQK